MLATLATGRAQVSVHGIVVHTSDQRFVAEFQRWSPRYPGELMVRIRFFEIEVNPENTEATSHEYKRVDYWFEGVDSSNTLYLLRTSTDEPDMRLRYGLTNGRSEIVFPKPFHPQDLVRLDVQFANGALTSGLFSSGP